MDTILLALALLWAVFGHMVLCVVLINRVHATRISTRVGKFVWLSVFVLVPSVPILFGYWFRVRASDPGSGFTFAALPPAAVPYLAACWLAASAAIVDWLRRQFTATPGSLRSHRRRVFRLRHVPAAPGSEDRLHHFLVRLPGNQTLDLDLVERGLDLRGLPPALDRFTVLHLSDLHFTGRIAKSYFQEVVRICNDLEPDVVAVTGDLVDNSACLGWIPDTFGRLKSRYGCYFVLGNHDVEVGARLLRATLEDVGLIDLGSRWLELAARGERIVLAGNELPWFPPAADFRTAPPPSTAGGPVRIALSHSPDQLPWAQRNEVDLFLAGHLHGGQIRFPLVGPIVSPSRHGVRYASGLFHAAPTVMHVSRGVSAEIPVRLNCGPEIAKLTLHATSLQGCERNFRLDPA
jgi:hypothetical protein